MNINCDRTASHIKPFNYNYKKCEQSYGELQKVDPDKFEDIRSQVTDMNEKVASLIDSNTPKITHNLSGSDRLFSAQEKLCHNITQTKKYCTHIKVSFPKEERKLDDNMMRNIGRDVLSKLNYDDVPYLTFKHSDEPHPHLHIVVNTIRNNGTNVDSSKEGIRSKIVERDLENKYGLIKKSDRIKEEKDGVRQKSLNEHRVADDSKIEPYTNILRKSVNIAYSDSVKSLVAFANRLSREGVSLKFREFKRETPNGIKSLFGVSYGFDKEDKNKIKFQYSDDVAKIRDRYIEDYKTPDNINEEFKGESFMSFDAVNDSGDKQTLYASRTFHNEVYVVNEELKHPKLPDRNVGIRGSQVGKRFNFKSLQENIGFSDNEVREYIEDKSNQHNLEESPAVSKLLHSTVRYNQNGINEALDEGAKIEDIKPIDWESLSKNQQELLTLSSQELKQEKSTKAKEKIEQKEEFDQPEELQPLDKMINDFKENYYTEINQKTIDLAEAFLNRDTVKMNSLLTYQQDIQNDYKIADTRIIGIENIMDNDDINPITKYTFKDQDDYIKERTRMDPSMSAKNDKAIAAATLAVDLALDNQDYEGLAEAVENDLVDYRRLRLNNTRWLDKKSNENLFKIANDYNIEQTNRQLIAKGFSPIKSQENNSDLSRSLPDPKADRSKTIDEEQKTDKKEIKENKKDKPKNKGFNR